MAKVLLPGDTVIIVGGGIPISAYRAYFENAFGKGFAPNGNLQEWLNTQTGKTVQRAATDYGNTPPQSVKALLAHERFDEISEADKEFICAFDEKMADFGYDCGNCIGGGFCWGKYMLIYAQTGSKGKKVAARIYVREGKLVLRLFLNGIDKRRAFVESAPPHIKSAFLAGSHGDCSCSPKKENCKTRKVYTIDGNVVEKCSGSVYEFPNPTAETLPDFIALLAAFYPIRK